MAKVIVIADDLTGSNATGVLLKKNGLDTCTVLNAKDATSPEVQRSGCLVIPTNSRAIPAEDAAKFRGGDLAAGYAAIPGNSVNFDFIWGSCRVVLPDGPECEPGKPVKVQLRVSNNDPSPKPLTLTWHLPEGWEVRGVKKHVNLAHEAHYSAPKTTFEAEIIPGDNVEASNRIVLVMEAAGRPVAAMIPIVLIG